jgi:small subunit ribosomal protein S20
MPITSSAKKALRASRQKRIYNLDRKDMMQAAVKNLRKLVSDKKIKEAQAALSLAYKAIDKTAKSNVINKNTASRYKARLSALVKKAKEVK